MRTLLATLCLLISTVPQLHAAMNVKAYQEAMQSSDKEWVALVKTYVEGLGEGMHVSVLANKTTPLFCVPGKLALGVDNFLDILDRQLQSASTRLSKENLEKMPIAVFLLSGLQETFPCK